MNCVPTTGCGGKSALVLEARRASEWVAAYGAHSLALRANIGAKVTLSIWSLARHARGYDEAKYGTKLNGQ